MVKNDIYFRGALIVSTLILVGIVSTYMVKSLDDLREDTLEEHIRVMRGSFISATEMEEGSSVVLKITDPPQGGHSELRISSGSVFYTDGDTRRSILQDGRIIPTAPPLNSGMFNESIAREVGSVSGGYSVKSPVELRITSYSTNEREVIFIEPLNSVEIERGEEIVSFFEKDFIPRKGWSVEMHILDEPYPVLSDKGFILISGKLPEEDGSCDLPIILPINTQFQLHLDEGSYRGDLKLIKRSVEYENGIFLEELVIEDL